MLPTTQKPDEYTLGARDGVDEIGQGRIFILCRTSSPGKRSAMGRNRGDESQTYEGRQEIKMEHEVLIGIGG